MPWLAAAVPAAIALGKVIVDATGKKHYVRPNQQNFVNPYADADRAELAARIAGYQNRQAPAMTAAQQAAVREYAGAQANMAALAQSQGVQLGPVTDTASERGTAALVNRQDQQFRDRQVALANALQAQSEGKGPSLAQEQMKQATDRNLNQQVALAASTGGGSNPALALRTLQNNAAATARQSARDATIARMQEQQNARAQLAGVLDSARGQDISVNSTQAGLDQNMSLANLQARNAALAANAEARNRFNLQQGQMDLNNNKFNAGAKNQYNQFAAGLEQQAQLANQAAFNEMLARNTQNVQQANMQNLASQLHTMGLNDEQIRSLLQQKLALGMDQGHLNRDFGTTSADLAFKADQARQAQLNNDWNMAQNAASGITSYGAQLAASDAQQPATPPVDPETATFRYGPSSDYRGPKKKGGR